MNNGYQSAHATIAAVLGVCLALVACGDDAAATPDGSVDTGVRDGDVLDSDRPDAGPSDSALEDGGVAPSEALADALGGQALVQALSAYRIVSEGTASITDEGHTPGESTPASVYVRTVEHDVTGDGVRVATDRTLSFLLLAGAPQSFELTISGDRGGITAGEHAFGFPGGPLSSDRIEATRRAERLTNPHLYVQGLLSGATAAVALAPEEVGGVPHAVYRLDNGVAPIELLVDTSTGNIALLRTEESDHLRRDVPVVVTYADWRTNPSGLRFPFDVSMSVASVTVLKETRTEVDDDPAFEAGHFDLPAVAMGGLEPDAALANLGRVHQHVHHEFASIGLPWDGPMPPLTSVEVTEGVHLVSGSLWNQMVVEQADGVVVVDAPMGQDRGEQMVAWVASNLGGKEISHVVPSHFHKDHAGSARTLLAEGAAFVIGEGTDAFFSDTVFGAVSTVRADAFGGTTPSVTVVPSASSVLLDDAVRPVRVYHIGENTHSIDMTVSVAEVAGQRYVFVADLVNPTTGTLTPGGPIKFIEALLLHGLLDETCAAPMPLTVLGAHGGLQPIGDLIADFSGMGVDFTALGCSP